MNRVTVRYVRFLSPGSFLADSWTSEVESADPHAVEWPERAYAFTLHERTDITDGLERFKGAPKQIGPTYYHPDSKIKTLAEIEAEDRKENRILIDNMRCNNWQSVIYSRFGNWPQPYMADDVCVLAIQEPGKMALDLEEDA